jgi:hypothetical protein
MGERKGGQQGRPPRFSTPARGKMNNHHLELDARVIGRELMHARSELKRAREQLTDICRALQQHGLQQHDPRALSETLAQFRAAERSVRALERLAPHAHDELDLPAPQRRP